MKTLYITLAILALIVLWFLVFEKKEQAPEFSLQDYDGNIITLADSAGKVRLVNSWATWCPFCVDELPDFVTIQEEFGDNIEIIAINRQEKLEQSKKFTDELSVTGKITLLLDPRDSFYKSINVTGGMPQTLFLLPDGEVFFHKDGPMKVPEIRSRVQEALNADNEQK